MSRVALFALCILIILAGMVQPASAMKYEASVLKAGASFLFSGYRFEGAELIDGDTQIGSIAGVSTLWRWSRRSVWMLVLEADYVQKGYAGKRKLPGVDPIVRNVDVLSDWISVPILGRVHFVEDKLTAYAVFGPSLEFQISHDEDPLLEEGKEFTVAANVGIGFEYELGRHFALQLEGRYFTDITNSWDGGDQYTVQSQRNQAFLVTGGLRF
ncbi:hypothetical protein DRQ53_06985 [bacterium]|nr:MAG: hypothetical protein DRQ32_04610 [bacterium]RKZ16176.1 MAG: hypothetical protein DRQ53_06985 [bacterium]